MYGAASVEDAEKHKSEYIAAIFWMKRTEISVPHTQTAYIRAHVAIKSIHRVWPHEMQNDEWNA